jgi:hypothetical protein
VNALVEPCEDCAACYVHAAYPQRPPTQMRPLQQFAVCAHTCPDIEQVTDPGVHVPWVASPLSVHWLPGQQSALVVRRGIFVPTVLFTPRRP